MGNDTIIHVSGINKHIFCNHAKEEIIKAYPELQGSHLTHNHMFTIMLKHLLGKNTYEIAVKGSKNGV